MNHNPVWHIRGARIIDPFRDCEATEEIFVHNGRFISRNEVNDQTMAVEVVDATGLWLVPRLTDMHVHFREPGQEWKETIATGSQAAAHGGFTVVCPMPNTTPVIDLPQWVEWQIQKAEMIGLVRLFPIGAVTKGSSGSELAELFAMEQKGAVAFSDDGRPVSDARIMRSALMYSTTLSHPIIQHAEDRSLAQGTAMHEGYISEIMGIPGVPEEAEAIMAWRDVELAGLTHGHLHIAHASAQGTLEAIRYAKRRGLHVTGEATPHHLYLTDEAVLQFQYRSITKVNPPLRPAASRDALVHALKTGIIDVIASDHAPHHWDEKQKPYVDAPYGISGLETSLGVVMTTLIHSGEMSPMAVFRTMTSAPHRILGIPYQGIHPGEAADFTLIDPHRRWQVDTNQFYSKGKNTPIEGEFLTGQAVSTMCRGRWTMREGQVIGA